MKASSWCAIPTRPSASTRMRWTSCTSTSNAPSSLATGSARDQHYMVEDSKVVIIDEYTGRRMPDRHWREGLAPGSEAKERVPVTMAADHAAQITFQSYFRLYKKLSGHDRHCCPELPGTAARVQALGRLCADQSAGHPQAVAGPHLSHRERQVRRNCYGDRPAARTGPLGVDRHPLGREVRRR